MQQSKSVVPPINAEHASQLLKALADPNRQQILQCLGAGERCVCDLTDDLNLAQSKLSFHLRVLKDAGLLADRQRGRWIYYRIEPSALEALQAWLGDLHRTCQSPAVPCDS